MTTPTVHAPVDVDLSTAEDVAARVRAAFDAGATHVVLDLSQVQFVDSSGLRALVNGAKRARSAGGRLELRSVPPVVRRVLDVSGLDVLLLGDGPA